MSFFTNILVKNNINLSIAEILSFFIVLFLVLLASVIAHFVAKKIILPLLIKYIKGNRYTWDNIFLERSVIHRIFLLVPFIIIYNAAFLFEGIENIFRKITSSILLIIILGILSATLNAINDIYTRYEISKERPIKGFLQVIKIILFIIMGIVILANLLDKSPLIYLSGLGAMAAVFSFIFKDSILGLVAGILLSLNDMLRIGDWIEMPKYGADGDVVDITMNTIKVQNFDKTISTIPAYALISDSFKNWRGMQDSGGRRIKRALHIDASSIKFCTDDMLQKFKKIQLLTEYIETKEKEIAQYNADHNIDDSSLVNGRHLTNIGVFRVYIENYLKHHPKIHQGLTQIVRQLPPDKNGLPLEIYAFTNDINWVNYEGIQADIFDHILAIMEEFHLHIFQNPAGHDIRGIKG
ncbi:MAG: mechanosensitive ion channel family protein [Tissierellales bacterium]|nr:mechanosensitive ion channel family protein [Tissierellales bacterium]MBN2826830.1 mechanosensitive ion channel family protein [Tissierellales bacterium]